MPVAQLRLRNRLNEEMTAQGIAARDLGARAGVNHRLIAKISWDRGYAPSGRVQILLAEALGVQIQDLFWSEPSEPETAEAGAS